MMQVHMPINTREIVNVLDAYAEIHKKKHWYAIKDGTTYDCFSLIMPKIYVFYDAL